MTDVPESPPKAPKRSAKSGRSKNKRRPHRALARSSRPRLLVAAPDGTLYEHPTLELALDTGLDIVRPSKRDLKPVPEGWDLMALPNTRPIGYDPETGAFETLRTFTAFDDAGKEVTFEPTAVALHPPPGFVRTHHPAAEWLDTTHPDEKFRELGKKTGAGRLTIFQDDVEPAQGGDDGARVGLPLWAYTAVGYGKSGPVAAFFQADETSRWAPELYYQESLDDKVEKRVAEDPDNPVLRQIAKCAKSSLCCCAQNIFYERWEGAVPIAPACTAACLGCLSKDPEWNTPTPQQRLKYSPKGPDIAKVMIHHLKNAPEPMISFGQGCEGEPTMYGDALVESVRLTREETKRGVININCNGSRPDVIRRAGEAGATALRLSLNTFDPEVYTLYYRPGDYTFDAVLESFKAGRDAGMHISINLLIWPGWTDRMAEVDAISKLVDDNCLHMIQLRNLCVDPGFFQKLLPPREKRGMLLGMRGFVDELHRRHPKLRFGTFNPRLAAEWWDDVAPLYGAA